jgi:muconolactone delta-isomerase
MKVLAIEQNVPGVTAEAFTPRLKRAEAARAWELYQAGVIRELYFRQDWPGAVLILECADVAGAHAALDSLPLVSAGLIAFEVIPLAPYPGFARLFAGDTDAHE